MFEGDGRDVSCHHPGLCGWARVSIPGAPGTLGLGSNEDPTEPKIINKYMHTFYRKKEELECYRKQFWILQGLGVKILMMIVWQMCRNKRALFKRVPGHRAFSFHFLVNPFLQLRSNKTHQLEFQSQEARYAQ